MTYSYLAGPIITTQVTVSKEWLDLLLAEHDLGRTKKSHDLGGLVTTEGPFKDPTISLVEKSRT